MGQAGGRPLIWYLAHGQWEPCLSLSVREQRGTSSCPLMPAVGGRGGSFLAPRSLEFLWQPGNWLTVTVTRGWAFLTSISDPFSSSMGRKGWYLLRYGFFFVLFCF